MQSKRAYGTSYIRACEHMMMIEHSHKRKHTNTKRIRARDQWDWILDRVRLQGVVGVKFGGYDDKCTYALNRFDSIDVTVSEIRSLETHESISFILYVCLCLRVLS